MKNQKKSETDLRVMPHFKKFTLPLFSLVFTMLTLIRTFMADPFGSLLDTWFALAFCLIYFGYLTIFLCADLTCKLLDRYYIWESHFKWRLFLQLGAGCALPLLLIIFICFPVFNFMGVTRLDNYYNFPGLMSSFIAMCCVNMFYIVAQYYLLFDEGMRMTSNKAVKQKTPADITPHESEKKTYREHFEVPYGSATKTIAVNEIAYLYRKGQDMFLITYSGDSHPFWQSLDAVESELDPLKFFRANPGKIVAFDAILFMEDIPNAVMIIHLKVKTHEQITVSREKKKVIREMILKNNFYI